ncbi:hypothetical protein OIU76_000782, partial [Salix suchowensis]
MYQKFLFTFGIPFPQFTCLLPLLLSNKRRTEIMPVFAESSSSTPATIADQIRVRKPRSQQELQPISTETDPNPHTSKSSKSNTIISSLFHSHFSTTPPDQTKKKGAAFRGLGCTAGAAQQVSVPAVIRSSADWEGKKVKKKKGHPKRKKESLRLFSDHNNNSNNTGNSNGDVNGDGNFANCMVMQDVWCGPGIGLSGADAVVGSVDCVVARRNVSIGRGKIDGGEKINQREREKEKGRGSGSGSGRE